MGADENHPLFPVLVVAALAPLVSELPIGVPLPPVVVEFLLGVVIGPFGLDLVEPVGFAARLAQFGLAALFFHAGLEIDTAVDRRIVPLAEMDLASRMRYRRLRGRSAVHMTFDALALAFGGCAVFVFHVVGAGRWLPP